jgi:hypothetical protein
MPLLLIWHICQIIVNNLSLVVTTCVLNQSKGHWLLSGAFNFAISMSLKFKKKLKNAPSFQTLIEEDSSVALDMICLASNIRKKVCIVFGSFFSFLRKYEKNPIICYP